MNGQVSDNDNCRIEFDSMVRGIFLQRDNRFRVQVLVNDQITAAHLPNSGRLGELLVEGATVWLTPAAHPHRRTQYDLSLVEYKEQMVSVDARLPGHLVDHALRCHALGKEFAAYPVLRREVNLGKSRIDFLLERKESPPYWIEVKSVTLVQEGTARFPDAPTTRGKRHVLELTDAVRRGNKAAVIFVIQRKDASKFQPHRRADPDFTDALCEAAAAGVRILALRCHITKASAQILGTIPVELEHQK